MIPNFTNKTEFLEFFEKDLKEDKAKLYAMKKATMKEADAVSYYLQSIESNKEGANKEDAIISTIDVNKLVVKSVINTTNILDSHGDVHIPGLWKKSLNETKNMMLLQEHQMKFDKVISDEVTPYTKNLSWKSLGFDYDGSTQALIFDSTIVKDRYNEMMFEMYMTGKVKNHSVGMRYVKVELAVDSKEKYWATEKETYDKYIDQIVNKEDVQGFFWVVLEAKVIEGSAVVRGSNIATPTMSVTETKEAVNNTSLEIEPPIGTQAKQVTLMQNILNIQKNKK
jgi:hypothetical protein